MNRNIKKDNYNTAHNRILWGLIGRFFVVFVLLVVPMSCKKFITVPASTTTLSAANVYTNDVTATAVLTGIYTKMSNAPFNDGNLISTSLFPGLSCDELKLIENFTITEDIQYSTNELTSDLTPGFDFWSNIYPNIYVINSAIEGINQSHSLTQPVKNQLLGEAKFLRAFCYFYLVNLYGDVPLSLNTDYKANAQLTRSSKTIVYQQIISDLKESKSLLNTDYLDGNLQKYTSQMAERVRPTKGAASAMLSRAYLYNGDWANAEAEATLLINNSDLYGIVALNDVFLKNSKEAIWQLQPVSNNFNTQDAQLFIIPPTGASSANFVGITDYLLNSFESGDLRKLNWIGSIMANNTTYYYPFKYKSASFNAPLTEYEMVLRLGEQYLIRAEARAQMGNLSGSQEDLNAIRNRAGLPNTTSTTQPGLLSAILHERQVELFTEWGHRWFDLKRSGTVDAVLSVIKGAHWQTTDQLYPIPQTEISRTPGLIQNPGY
jgi:uncharacterized membrane protein (DUF485 family)